MPAWLEVLAVSVGSGALAGLLVGVVAPFVQQRASHRGRERAGQRARVHDRDRHQKRMRERSDAEVQAQVHAARRAQQHERCTALLDAVGRWNTLLLTLRAQHDHPATGLALHDLPEAVLHQLPLLAATVQSFQRALDAEPEPVGPVLLRLQVAVERFGAAAVAYQRALVGPMAAAAQWYTIQPSLGTMPQEEVRRRAEAYDVCRCELELAVRTYVASLEA